MLCSPKSITEICFTTIGLLLVSSFFFTGTVEAETAYGDSIDEEKAEAIADSLEEMARDLERSFEEESDVETTITIKRTGGAVRISHSPEDVVQIGSSAMVDAETQVRGDVVAVGGSATVYGHVLGDVVAIGGNVVLRDDATVQGDAVAIGGRVIRDDDTRVYGETVSIAPGVAAFFPWSISSDHDKPRHRIGGLFAGIMISWLVLFFFALIFAGLITKATDRVGAALRHDPLKAGFAGFLVLVLSPFVLVILGISIIGIPLIPVYIAMLVVAVIWGLIASALELGRGFGTRLYSDTSKPVVTAIIGIILLTLPKHLGKLLIAIGGPFHIIGWSVMVIGSLVVLLAIFIGLGGILFTRFGRRDGNGIQGEIEEADVVVESTEKRGGSGHSMELPDKSGE